MSSNYTPWERVQISRSAERPTSLDYISTIFERYMSLHGDRYFGDDKAIVGGLASIGGRPVTVIGQQKGRSTKENIKRNFGMPSPEGYRKSLRLMKQAEKFHRPMVEPWLWLLEMKCGVWKILHILYCLQKDLQRFFGKMGTGLPKLLKL